MGPDRNLRQRLFLVCAGGAVAILGLAARHPASVLTGLVYVAASALRSEVARFHVVIIGTAGLATVLLTRAAEDHDWVAAGIEAVVLVAVALCEAALSLTARRCRALPNEIAEEIARRDLPMTKGVSLRLADGTVIPDVPLLACRYVGTRGGRRRPRFDPADVVAIDDA